MRNKHAHVTSSQSVLQPRKNANKTALPLPQASHSSVHSLLLENCNVQTCLHTFFFLFVVLVIVSKIFEFNRLGSVVNCSL